MAIAETEGGVVALSTYEAEYVAATTAACQAVWLRRLLGELTGAEAHPPALMVDNQPAIAPRRIWFSMTGASTST